MSDDTTAPFLFPGMGRKKVTAAFDGGRIASDGGVMLLAAAERRLGIADRLAELIVDPRTPLFVTHSIADILRARMLAIACGYEDADDLDHLRTDPGFKLACGRLPDSGRDLCSQPTVSRWENAPTLREVVRLTYAMIDTYCASYPKPPKAVTLDIDDTVDVVHGHQQLALFNAHHDERCFMPIHVYDTALVHTDEYSIYARLPAWGYGHKTVCHTRGEYARDEDGDGFCEVHVNTMEGFWSLLRSWLRPHRGISQDKLPLYLSFFQFVHNARRRGKALLGTLIAGLVA